MKKYILIAGGSGYLGRHIINQFGSKYNFINISLTNRAKHVASNLLIDLAKPLDFLQLDVEVEMIINCVESHPSSYNTDSELKRAYINVVQNLIDYAKLKNIKKLIHFSVNNLGSVNSDYYQAKFVAEGLVARSDLDYVVFKPSIIFGDNSPLDRFVEATIGKVVLPKFWDNDIKIAPVHISDVLANVEKLLTDDSGWCQKYSLCGPSSLSFEEILYRKVAGKLRAYNPPDFVKNVLISRLFEKSSKKHLTQLLEWINCDNLCIKPPLLQPKISY